MAGDLTFAEASTESPYGLIREPVGKEGGCAKTEREIPPNSTATVYVPTSKANSVTESGKAIFQSDGVKPLRTEGNYAVFQVEAGNYEFKAKL